MDMKDWSRFADEFMSRLNGKGVFLTTKAGGKANTMTMSWGSVGVYWSKPVVTVPVRLSRHTHGNLEQSGEFTISIPRKGEMNGELDFCGTKSGRDMDKFAAAALTARPGRKIATPVVGEAWMHIECRVLMKAGMQTGSFAPGMERMLYPGGDVHTLYMGEVVDFYET